MVAYFLIISASTKDTFSLSRSFFGSLRSSLTVVVVVVVVVVVLTNLSLRAKQLDWIYFFVLCDILENKRFALENKRFARVNLNFARANHFARALTLARTYSTNMRTWTALIAFINIFII